MSGIKKTARELAQERCDAFTAAAHQRAAALEAQIMSLHQKSKELASDISATHRHAADLTTRVGDNIRLIGQEISGEFPDAQTNASQQERVQAELNLLRSESAAYAYASLVALEKQGYQLRETITGRNIQAWFTEQGDPSRIILLTIGKQENEGNTWLEELKMSGFDDDCLDVLDLYDNDIAAMGVRKRSRTIIKPDDSGQKQRRSSSARERRLEKE